MGLGGLRARCGCAGGWACAEARPHFQQRSAGPWTGALHFQHGCGSRFATVSASRVLPPLASDDLGQGSVVGPMCGSCVGVGDLVEFVVASPAHGYAVAYMVEPPVPAFGVVDVVHVLGGAATSDTSALVAAPHFSPYVPPQLGVHVVPIGWVGLVWRGRDESPRHTMATIVRRQRHGVLQKLDRPHGAMSHAVEARFP